MDRRKAEIQHDTWLAHRFDLGSAHLRSYKFCSEESEVDGRPFRCSS